ncbi:hypothetical protein [Bradyrhizobium sp. MOS002]|uniref:hypothetical protein n=1 Tax=Bradyrhizobium sp. MOS002 TaxID=2133947 RepID=UPI000D12A946|nr:hypothetical protein [Bradyrhizobium sp. MOS002]PSO22711.1 hypothetical protein C7G41_33860 [Bradyrhizobium sp. MOS002]
MDKKIAGLLGAVAALGSFGAADAAPSPAPADVLHANSYADLLAPIPNAGALLQAVDESAFVRAGDNVQLAQFYHHHHHHHHHSFYRRYRDYDAPVVVVPRYRRYYRHHHHHHHSFYRRDY